MRYSSIHHNEQNLPRTEQTGPRSMVKRLLTPEQPTSPQYRKLYFVIFNRNPILFWIPFCLQQGVSPYKELLPVACNQLPGTQNETAFLVSDSLYEQSQDLLEGSISSLSWYRCTRDIQLRLISLKVVKEGASEPASTHGKSKSCC